ncbi:MAG: hypothetical protein J7L61_02855, partial [Thermoplasmata archaeon]|nr:hypothetical protein [Thermoplasmata archaeon]
SRPPHLGRVGDVRVLGADPVSNVQKTLYLNDNDDLSTTPGSSTVTTTIRNNRDNQWDQTPPFAKDFHISGDPVAVVYMDPTQATGLFNQGWPDVTFNLGYDTTTLGTVTLTDVNTAGWYSVSFPAANGTTIPAGSSVFLDIEVTSARRGRGGRDGYVDVYYDSPSYPSRIDMETDTYVHVDDVTLYNSTGRTDVFSPGEQVEVRANVSDPFGSYDISAAYYSIYYPNGTVLIDNQSMTATGSNTTSVFYNASFTLPATAPSGEYRVEVMGVESNGVAHNYSTSFFIPSLYGVSVYPDQTKEGSPGNTVSYDMTVKNTGIMNDTYEITVGPSTQGWKTKLYIGGVGGTLVASDDDGDGTWDYVNPAYDTTGDGNPDVFLSGLSSQDYTLVKTVPNTASPGITDQTLLTATSATNSSITDSAQATTTMGLTWPHKSLFMRDDDTLQTSPGSVQDQLTITDGGSNTWTQSSPFAKDFLINSTAMIYIYIDPTKATGWFNQGWPDVTATLSYDGTVLGSYTYDEVSTAGWYTFPISSASGVTVPAGSSLEITVNVTDAGSGILGREGSAVVYHGDAAYPSNVTMSTSTYVHVDNITLYNGSLETYEFTAGDTVNVEANLSDPFGSYDIVAATMNVYYPNGSLLTSWQPMGLLSTDSSPLSSWKIYNSSFVLPSDAPVGEYTVEVRGNESDGAYHYNSVKFRVRCNVSIEPDNTGTGYPGTTVTYTHYINNTGKGSDLYNLYASSTQGWNVSIYDGGTLMAYDSDGDRDWDYVNPAYDRDGDGNPDTGIMHRGDTFTLTVTIDIPSSSPLGVTDTTTLTVISRRGTCTDSAVDVTHVIPSFSSDIVPAGTALAIFLGIRRLGKGKRWERRGEAYVRVKDKGAVGGERERGEEDKGESEDTKEGGMEGDDRYGGNGP